VPARIGFKPWIKTLLYWLIFLALYGAYKALPGLPLSLVAGINESNFQHYKAMFWCYLLVNAIEFLIYRKRLSDRSTYWYAALLATVSVPWLTFLLWYIVPAVYGKLPSTALEIIYANIITILTGSVTVVLQGGLEQIRYTRSLKIIIVTLVIVSIGLYLIFTFKLPWADVFVEPNWR
jgi:hypothetical protein